MPSPISKMTFFTVGPVGPDSLALGNPATKSATTIKQAIVEIFKKFFFTSITSFLLLFLEEISIITKLALMIYVNIFNKISLSYSAHGAVIPNNEAID
jgi:hypothetical protein